MSKRLLELAELRDLAAKRRRLQMQAAREAADAATAAEAASAEAAGAASPKVRKAKACMLDFFARPWTAIWPKPATQQPQPSKPRHTSCTESAEALPFESEQAAFLREEEAGRLLWKSRKVNRNPAQELDAERNAELSEIRRLQEAGRLASKLRKQLILILVQGESATAFQARATDLGSPPGGSLPNPEPLHPTPYLNPHPAQAELAAEMRELTQLNLEQEALEAFVFFSLLRAGRPQLPEGTNPTDRKVI